MKFTSTVLSFFLFSATAVDAVIMADSVCKNGTYAPTGHYYEVVQYEKGRYTWHEASQLSQERSFCNKKGHLVTLTSDGESNYVVDMLDSNGECSTVHDSWMGLTDATTEGTFEWVTGEPYDWHKWCPGQPSGGGEDYGEIWINGDNDGCWNDNEADTNGSANGADNDKYIVEYDCDAPVVPTASGDPHFKTWSGKQYDFHGGCDLVLLKNPDFANGLGMNVHIRTAIKAWWSYIQAAVIQVGEHTLEITGGQTIIQYRFNGEKEGHELQTGDASLGDYAIKFVRINGHQSRTRIVLGKGEAISIETFKDFVRVNVDGSKTPAMYAGSAGLLGSYPSGEMTARDGVTTIEDANEFGQEWRVRAGESMLFHDKDSVQPLDTCTMPTEVTKAEGRRRLGESAIKEEDAALACARVSSEDRDACIFDVMATNDKDMAGSY